MLTPPEDLPEPVLRTILAEQWSLDPVRVDYRPVGFGSHHWQVTDPAGAPHFVTVDDLRTRRRSTDETVVTAYGRLRSALAAAQALRAVGHDFVVAPLPSRAGEPLAHAGACFAVSVYPFIDGESFDWTLYDTRHRHVLLDLIATVHSAPASARGRALADDYSFPFRDDLVAILRGSQGDEREQGPYSRPAAELLIRRAPQVHETLNRFDDLVGHARTGRPELVLTHGEPHPGNTMRTPDGWRLLDWDTALRAPRERDLWHIDPGDGSLYAAYTAATGHTLDPRLLSLYRLRWDLAEAAIGVARFRAPHSDSADDHEAWANLEESITSMARQNHDHDESVLPPSTA